MSARFTALFLALSLVLTVGTRQALAEPPAEESVSGTSEQDQSSNADTHSDSPDSRKQDANAGQHDLDQAVEAKLKADAPQDLAEVIMLCQRALDKGLDAANRDFAEKLLASTLFQRGRMITDAIFAPPQPDPRWPQMRQLALQDLIRSIKRVRNQPQAHLLIAKLESLPGGDPKRALQAVEDTIQTAGDDTDVKFEAVMLHSGMIEDPKGRIADFDEAIKLRPDDPVPLRLRGSLKLSLGKRTEAIEDFDAAIKLDPKNAATYEIRGMALAMLKRMDEARDSYAHAVELAPESPALLLQRAQVNYLTEKFAEAIADASKALKIDPNNPAALLLRAQAYARSDKTVEAMADVNNVLKEQPNLPPALRTRAVLLAGDGKTDDAIRDLSRVYEQEPEDVETAFQLAMLYRTKKNFTKAMELINAAVEAEPDNWFVHYGRGDLLLGMGKHRQAVADYEVAYKQNPEDSGLLNNFAWLLATSPDAKVRDGKRAIELATEACKLTDYKASHILSTLAAGYAETGDFESARKWSQKAVEVAKNDSTRGQLEKELASYKVEKPWRELLHDDVAVSQLPDDDQQQAPGGREAKKTAAEPKTIR